MEDLGSLDLSHLEPGIVIQYARKVMSIESQHVAQMPEDKVRNLLLLEQKLIAWLVHERDDVEGAVRGDDRMLQEAEQRYHRAEANVEDLKEELKRTAEELRSERAEHQRLADQHDELQYELDDQRRTVEVLREHLADPRSGIHSETDNDEDDSDVAARARLNGSAVSRASYTDALEHDDEHDGFAESRDGFASGHSSPVASPLRTAAASGAGAMDDLAPHVDFVQDAVQDAAGSDHGGGSGGGARARLDAQRRAEAQTQAALASLPEGSESARHMMLVHEAQRTTWATTRLQTVVRGMIVRARFVRFLRLLAAGEAPDDFEDMQNMPDED